MILPRRYIENVGRSIPMSAIIGLKKLFLVCPSICQDCFLISHFLLEQLNELFFIKQCSDIFSWSHFRSQSKLYDRQTDTWNLVYIFIFTLILNGSLENKKVILSVFNISMGFNREKENLWISYSLFIGSAEQPTTILVLHFCRVPGQNVLR